MATKKAVPKDLNVSQDLLKSTKWRSIGPFRGGRVVAVAGHPRDSLTFYFGACAGGVWKTTDAGTYWENVSDGFFNTAAVGAIAVSESDPDTIYAGTGESCIRGDVSHGDGVYKSTDGGKTWTHIGLSETRHIARIRIHPQNPDVVYVAALGHAFGPNEQRGVFRSNDGGNTWDRILFKSNLAGAIDLSMDPQNPRIIYASLWEVIRQPWSLSSGGDDSGIYKSIDGGTSWTNLTDSPGMPDGIKGRIGVALSPAKKDLVWAMIEAENGGLFRSNNGGQSWEKINEDAQLRVRPWYYSHVVAHPSDPETVYVLTSWMWKSTDGGHTFSEMIMPHGDHHDLWIDPNNTERMIQGNDGGACVSLNNGETWSTIYNQPTSQFYHVDTDNQFPYRVYATQQDNTAISVPHRNYKQPIHYNDCYPCGNSESGYIAVRPDNPNIVYSGAIGSSSGGGDSLIRYDHSTGQTRTISIWPEMSWGWGVKDLKYRFQWTYPILISPHDPNTLYAAGNMIFKTQNEGENWEIISPDLTKQDNTKMEASGGPISLDTTGVEHYGTIFALAESPIIEGLFWVGTDDGLIHLSENGGKSWRDITPPDLPEWTLISIIEPSPYDPKTAYVAATRYKLDDTRPLVYKTNDLGKSWMKISNGIPNNDFTRVIRSDKMHPGLLYLGTETGMYISFNDGESWQSIRQNLPAVPIHDLAVKENELVAATHGRSFWILDNLELIRQVSKIQGTSSVHLFKPANTYRIAPPMTAGVPSNASGKKYNMGIGTLTTFYDKQISDNETTRVFLDSGTNPPTGVVVNYFLENPSDINKIILTFMDDKDNEIQSFSNKNHACGDSEEEIDPKPNLTTLKGTNQFVWDMRYPEAKNIPGDKTCLQGIPGPLAIPGNYKVGLKANDRDIHIQNFELLPDPRITATSEDYQSQFGFLINIREKLSNTHNCVLRVRKIRTQISQLLERTKKGEQYQKILESSEEIEKKLISIEENLIHPDVKTLAELLKYPSMLNVKLAELRTVVASSDAAPTKQSYEVFTHLSELVDYQLQEFENLIQNDIANLIELANKLEIPAIITNPDL